MGLWSSGYDITLTAFLLTQKIWENAVCFPLGANLRLATQAKRLERCRSPVRIMQGIRLALKVRVGPLIIFFCGSSIVVRELKKFDQYTTLPTL